MAEASRGPGSDQFVQHDSKFVRKKIVSKSKSKKKVEIKEEEQVHENGVIVTTKPTSRTSKPRNTKSNGKRAKFFQTNGSNIVIVKANGSIVKTGGSEVNHNSSNGSKQTLLSEVSPETKAVLEKTESNLEIMTKRLDKSKEEYNDCDDDILRLLEDTTDTIDSEEKIRGGSYNKGSSGLLLNATSIITGTSKKGENDIYDEKFNPKSLHNGSLPTKVGKERKKQVEEEEDYICPGTWFSCPQERRCETFTWKMCFFCLCLPGCYPCYLSRTIRRRNQKRHDIERRNLEAGNHGNLISRAQNVLSSQVSRHSSPRKVEDSREVVEDVDVVFLHTQLAQRVLDEIERDPGFYPCSARKDIAPNPRRIQNRETVQRIAASLAVSAQGDDPQRTSAILSAITEEYQSTCDSETDSPVVLRRESKPQNIPSQLNLPLSDRESDTFFSSESLAASVPDSPLTNGERDLASEIRFYSLPTSNITGGEKPAYYTAGGSISSNSTRFLSNPGSLTSGSGKYVSAQESLSSGSRNYLSAAESLTSGSTRYFSAADSLDSEIETRVKPELVNATRGVYFLNCDNSGDNDRTSGSCLTDHDVEQSIQSEGLERGGTDQVDGFEDNSETQLRDSKLETSSGLHFSLPNQTTEEALTQRNVLKNWSLQTSRVSGRLMNNMLGEIKPEDGCEDKEEGKEVEVAGICDRNKNNQICDRDKILRNTYDTTWFPQKTGNLKIKVEEQNLQLNFYKETKLGGTKKLLKSITGVDVPSIHLVVVVYSKPKDLQSIISKDEGVMSYIREYWSGFYPLLLLRIQDQDEDEDDDESDELLDDQELFSDKHRLFLKEKTDSKFILESIARFYLHCSVFRCEENLEDRRRKNPRLNSRSWNCRGLCRLTSKPTFKSSKKSSRTGFFKSVRRTMHIRRLTSQSSQDNMETSDIQHV